MQYSNLPDMVRKVSTLLETAKRQKMVWKVLRIARNGPKRTEVVREAPSLPACLATT